MPRTATTVPLPPPLDGEVVQRALRRLPARHRAALVLRLAEGLSEREIAAVLGCGVATVRSLVSRGVRRLRQQLNREGAAEDHPV